MKQTLLLKLLPLIIFGIAFLLYSNTLKFQYACDDGLYTYSNKYVQKGVSSIPHILTHSSIDGLDLPYFPDYRPTVPIIFSVESSLFGSSPSTHHFFNVFYYSLLCVLIFLFLRQILFQYPPILLILITLLYVFHPIHTEVVANIKGRDEIIPMLFGIISLYTIYLYFKNKNTIYFLLSLVAFTLATFSKPCALTFFPITLLVLYFFTDVPFKRQLKILMPFAILSFSHLYVRSSILTDYCLKLPLLLNDNSLLAATNIGERTSTVFSMLLVYLKLLFFQIKLSREYSYNTFSIVSITNIKLLISHALHLALLAIAIKGLREKN